MSTIYDLLPTFHQIEPNNLKGLQAGMVVAQMGVKDGCTLVNKTARAGFKFLENGHLCSISAAGVDIWAADTPMFIVFNEELLTTVQGHKYYATDLDAEDPRLVQLFPGDEWMSDIDYDTDPLYAGVKAELDKHVVKITDKNVDDFYGTTTLADGTKAYHYMYLG
jgi:hypothetical protein